MDYKHEDTHAEIADPTADKVSIENSKVQQQVHVSEEDSRHISRKTDLNLLPVLVFVYFLQALDKNLLGYSTVFGLKEDAGLVGDQYSVLAAMGYYAQLVAQLLGAVLLVKYSVKHLLPGIVFFWGVSLTCMAACTNFSGLAATRFFLGWFEAMALPIFSLITVNYYRRSEQPMRVAAWYTGNGWASLFGSLISYGCGHIKSDVLYSYQIIFLLNGLITVVTGAGLYWFIDHGVHDARFISPEDRIKAVERLRANNTGLDEDSKFKWRQAVELFCEPKTYLFLLMTICVNMGASVVSVFAPLLLQGLAGFDAYTTSLLSVPFGALQVTVILLASWAATRWRLKSPVFMIFMAPVIVGTVLMYTLPRTPKNKSALLFGYYMLSFVFSANPIILAWIAANTAGKSKKSALYSAYNAASAIGNLIAPQLFKAADAPLYLPGLKATLAFFCVLEGLIVTQVFVLFYLNKRKERERVANGKPAKIHDLSPWTPSLTTPRSSATIAFKLPASISRIHNTAQAQAFASLPPSTSFISALDMPPPPSLRKKQPRRKPTVPKTPTYVPKRPRALAPAFSPPSGLVDLRLSDFPDTPAGLRAWNESWERELSLTYQASSPSFIIAREATYRSHYLNEHSFRARKRGREAVAGGGATLLEEAGLGFSERVEGPWKSAGRERREEMVLEVLKRAENEYEGREDQRLLIPEVTLEEMAGGEGEGFLRLVKTLLAVASTSSSHSPDGSLPIVHHEQLDRLYGFNSTTLTEAIPASKGLRAYQEELSLIRRSALQGFCCGVIGILTGAPIREVGRAGNVKAEGPPKGAFSSECDYADVLCAHCKEKSSEETKFQMCSRCFGVGRAEHYCSRECQKADFAEHKKTCGKLLSEVMDVPVYSIEPNFKSATSLNPALLAQLHEVRRWPEAIWCILPTHPKDQVVGLARTLPPTHSTFYSTEVEFRRQMGKARQRAVYEKHELSTALVCYFALDCAQQRGDELYLAISKQIKDERDAYTAARKARVTALRTQLVAEFELVDESRLEELLEMACRDAPEWASKIMNAATGKMQDDERQLDLLDRGRIADVFKMFDTSKFTEDNVPESIRNSENYSFEKFSQGLEMYSKVMTYSLIEPKLQDPDTSQEEKDRIYTDILKRADAWVMDDGKVEEVD